MKSFLILTTLALLLAGCITPAASTQHGSKLTPTVTPLPLEPVSTTTGRLAEAANHFGFDLLQQLSGLHNPEPNTKATTKNPLVSPLPSPQAVSISPLATPAAAVPRENIFLSPLSLALALQMTYNGAGGETAAEMARVLHIAALDLGQANPAAKELQDNLRAAQGVELAIGNSLWLKQGWELNPEFAQRNRTYFDASLEVLDFSSPEALDRINGWAAEATRGKIDKVLDEIDDEILFLLNAVYFKGDWQSAFDPERTRPWTFHRADGTTKEIPMMLQSETFPFLVEDGFQAVALPYQGDRVRMLVFLPDEDKNLNAVLTQLTPENWQTWTAGFQSREIFMGLPRFQMKFSRELNRNLEALGMTTAFDPVQANFLGMLPESPRPSVNLYLSLVKHDAVVEVNEEGTVAAAVSTVGVPTSAPPEFIVDRPFFFAIWDSHTGAILFMGAAVDPEAL